MTTGLILSVLVLGSAPCALRAQMPVRLIPRQSLVASPAEMAALPEAPSPVWSSKELAVETACPWGKSNGEPCAGRAAVYDRFVDSGAPRALTAAQKGVLAVHNLFDRGNLATITGSAAFTSLTNSHTAYGPGWLGFGRGLGTGLLGDATGQFFGTFAIPALTHEEPRYHRMPHASVPRRVLHAVSRTVLAQSDSGRLMPNYSALGTYPISAEIANLYVPGIHGNGPSTVARVLTGYATDPVDNLVTEFLPDVARRVHVHVVFAQQILNGVSRDDYPSLP